VPTSSSDTESTASTSVDNEVDAEVDINALQLEIEAWLAKHWVEGVDRHEFLDAVVDAGYATPRWAPELGGLGLASPAADTIAEAFARAGAPGAGQDLTNLWAGTLVEHAPEDLRDHLVRRLLTGRLQMCLLYSEPGAGSDLGGLQTRAEPDGAGGWIVTGQKVWTSNAPRAEYGFLLARTDWDVPKRQGISFLLLPMQQPGIDIRPIRQITGETHFNEVFIDEAHVPSGHLLGEVGGGWRVLKTALAYERAHMGARARLPNIVGGEQAGQSTARVGDDLDLLGLAKELGSGNDPILRQDLTRIVSLQRIHHWNGQRGKDESRLGRPSPVGALAKLGLSRFFHQRAHVQHRLVGAEAMLDGAASNRAAVANFMSLNAYFTSIGGGTDEIQRNIIGERVLGLPRDVEVDSGLPFREVRKAQLS
jgi:alkylation response protein AidB-like acyl-CoA dehydrogenase